MRKLLILLIAVVSVTAFKCSKSEQSQFEAFRSKLHIELPRPFPAPNFYRTPKGVTVTTSNPIPNEAAAAAVLENVDAGISDLLASVENLGYGQLKSHADYYVVMTSPTARTLDGNCPALLMKDGGKIAGTVINFQPAFMPEFVYVAENYNENEYCNQYLQDVIRFEGEHRIAYYNDRAFFDAHLGENDRHPLYKLPGERRPNSQIAPDIFSCGITISGKAEKQFKWQPEK